MRSRNQAARLLLASSAVFRSQRASGCNNPAAASQPASPRNETKELCDALLRMVQRNTVVARATAQRPR